MAAELRVDGERLWSRLMAMARIGATVHGGCNRQALTDADREGRQLLSGWAQAAGCTVRTDAIGNVFLRRPGSEAGLPVVMTGSHLDTQPTGGKFDGVYGVLAGLEVIETLNERALGTRHPIELAVWCNEEGSRFPMAMMGSAVWAGRLPLESAYELTDRAGVSVRSELERLRIDTTQSLERQAVKAALEVHIEQGPVLEQQTKTIGVVTGVQHMSRHEISVIGQEAHAGPTPMHMRRDPIRVLAEVLPKLYAVTESHGPEARFTVGVIETRPGSPNTVPGSLRFTVDVRHPDAHHYAALKAAVHETLHASLKKQGLEGQVRCVWEAPGVVFDATCVEAVRRATHALGFAAIDMVSGAGHDSCNLSAVVPTAMVFVPCAGGLSHNEAESATAADLAAGANVLLHAMLALAH
jgi:beta-ureidopropionase / N-carbamoyl-L-amino-acid hydrolase